MHNLLDYAHFVRETPPDKFKLTRPKLNYIKAQSEAAEEILDAMGARTNAEWFPTRECVAILKNFSTSTYELLHVHVSAPYYSLGDKLEKFKEDTAEHLSFMTEVIRLSLINLHDNTTRLGITIDQNSVNYVFKEILVVPKLRRNMPSTEPGSVKHRIDAMAINVLNSTEDMKSFKKLFESSVSDWDKLDFDFLSETKIRSLEVNMHTLQSMYDTYISDRTRMTTCARCAGASPSSCTCCASPPSTSTSTRGIYAETPWRFSQTRTANASARALLHASIRKRSTRPSSSTWPTT